MSEQTKTPSGMLGTPSAYLERIERDVAKYIERPDPMMALAVQLQRMGDLLEKIERHLARAGSRK